MIHSKIYGVAEMYQIHGLKQLAKIKLVAAMWTCGQKDLWEAAEHVYASTLDNDRGLRDFIVEGLLFYRRRARFNERIKAELQQLHPLCYDLLSRLAPDAGISSKVTGMRFI